jgi:hypothetical protein
MFMTETEAQARFEVLPQRVHFEITYTIENRRTGQRAAVTFTGERPRLLDQVHSVYEDGWGLCGLVNFTRRNTDWNRTPVGANQTCYGR